MSIFWFGLAWAVLAPPGTAPQTPRERLLVHHAGMACLPEHDYAVIAAEVTDAAELRAVRVYFRSTLYPDFYYVTMKEIEGIYIGVLPQPAEETREIAYYVEAVDAAFASARSPEFVVPVRDPCSEKRKAAVYMGDDGGIVVGATTTGASPLPPGFRAIGIVGTITAAGAAATVGGGLGAGTIVVAGAAAAGATGAVVVATGDDSSTTSSASTTSSVIASGTTSAAPPPMTTTSAAAPPATTTASSSSSSSSSTTPPATTVPGSTTSSASTTSAPPTTSVASTTSAPPSSTSVPVAPPVACFTVIGIDVLCRLRLDASCSTGAIDAYEWTLDAGGALDGPVTATGQVANHDYGLFPFCFAVTVTNVLTVSGPGGTDSFSQTYRFLLQRAERETVAARFVTRLATGEPPARGSIAVNGEVVAAVAGPSPVVASFRPRAGVNEVDARLDGGAFAGTGEWSFELDETEGIVPGSLAVGQGELLALSPTRVAFRVDGSRPTPIRFRFELRARSR